MKYCRLWQGLVVIKSLRKTVIEYANTINGNHLVPVECNCSIYEYSMSLWIAIDNQIVFNIDISVNVNMSKMKSYIENNNKYKFDT